MKNNKSFDFITMIDALSKKTETHKLSKDETKAKLESSSFSDIVWNANIDGAITIIHSDAANFTKEILIEMAVNQEKKGIDCLEEAQKKNSPIEQYKKYMDDIEKSLSDIRYKLTHKEITVSDIEEAAFSAMKVILILENSTEYEHKKTKNIISLLNMITNLMIISKKQIGRVELHIFKCAHENIHKAIKFFKKYQDHPNLSQESLYRITSCFNEASKKLTVLDQEIQKVDSFRLACDAFSQCRDDVNSLFIKLMETPLDEHGFFKQEIEDILDIMFDDNIILLDQWTNHTLIQSVMYFYCSNYGALGNTRH